MSAIDDIRAQAKRRVEIMRRAERFFATLRRDLSALSEDDIMECEEKLTVLISEGPLRGKATEEHASE